MKKVFISSTCYDLVDIRAEVATSLKEWGYEPVYNESPNFPKKSGLHSHDVCIEAVKECDYYLLIIDRRYGGKYSGNNLKNTDGKSITWCEADTAYAEGMPVFTFVRQNAWTERESYKNNLKKGNKFDPTFVDKTEVFDFINFIVRKDKDNWIDQFETSVKIKESLKPWLAQASCVNKPKSLKNKIHYITAPAPYFTGRKDYLEALSTWYGDAKVKVGCLEGFGGIGKSSIARRWYDDMESKGVTPEGIFWWGFYKDRSLDNFLDHLLEFASGGRPSEEVKSSGRKVEFILDEIEERELFIVLDGFEEMQRGKEAGENFGKCVNAELGQLLAGLCDGGMRGLCLVTTRYPLKDVEGWRGKNFADKRVEHLSKADGRELLESYGLKGEKKEIEKLAEDYGGHALSLTLLATLLVKRYGGKVEDAAKIPSLSLSDKAGGKARRILHWYNEQLAEEERIILRIHSLFRREVLEEDFPVFTGDYSYNKALQGMDDFDFRALLDDLLERRLLSGTIGEGFDAHPLVREYFDDSFDDEEKRACHEAIYRHIEKTAPVKPETLEKMAPLFAMVRHGCAAGLYDEVFLGVYHEKIDRRDEGFLTIKLGAWETDLELVRCFFPGDGLEGLPLVSNPSAQAYLMNEAALALQNTGRPIEAIPLYQRQTEMQVTSKNWYGVSVGLQNLTNLRCYCGTLEGALGSAGKAFDAAGKVEDEGEKKRMLKDSMAYLACCCVLMGDGEEAGRQFREAEGLQLEISPAVGGLYSLPGVWYAEFLLADGKVGEARASAERNLEICKENNFVNSISRCRRILGEIARLEGDCRKAEEELEDALALAMRVGMPELEIEALLARGRLCIDTGDAPNAVKAADRVLAMVERTTFYLYEPDALNILARAAILEGDKEAARGHAEKAKEKAEKMGYALAKDAAEGILREIGSS